MFGYKTPDYGSYCPLWSLVFGNLFSTGPKNGCQIFHPKSRAYQLLLASDIVLSGKNGGTGTEPGLAELPIRDLAKSFSTKGLKRSNLHEATNR